MADSRGIGRSVLDRFEKTLSREVAREASGLHQSEIAGNEPHYHNNTIYVENIVHVSSSFLSRFIVERQMPMTLLRERPGERLACRLTVRCGSMGSPVH